ncbi:MAG: dTMP kinase [Candidatus Heimdallarchaeaceae archaeon]
MNLETPSKGFFVVLEGIDGVGKTTQAHLLVDFLKSKNYGVAYTTEPTRWSPYGKRLRESFFAPERLPVFEEFRLFLEDRKEHVKEEVIPLMEEGKIVVCDRYYYSSVAYQGSRGLDWKMILKENMKAVFPPNIVFLIDIPVEEALERISNGRNEGINTFEKKENLTKVREIYKELVGKFPDKIRVIDGTRSIEEVHKDIVRMLLPLL